MKFRSLIVLSLLSLTACPQAGQFLGGSGNFDANKTTSGGEKTTDGSDSSAANDKIISADAPPPTAPPPSSPPPLSAPPEGLGGNPSPTGGNAAQGSGAENEMMMAFRGPIDPKNDGEHVNPSSAKYRLKYGSGLDEILTEDGSSDPLILFRNAPVALKLLLEVNIHRKGWVPASDGDGVRLIFIADGKTEADAKCTDAAVKNDVTADDNLSFSNLPLGAGQIFFYISTGSSGCGGPGLSDFGADYRAFIDDTEHHPDLGSRLVISPTRGIRQFEP